MIGSVFTSGVCHCVFMCMCVYVCVCVFRMLFEKPVLLTADHWYTAVACVSSPSGASSDAGSSGQREITGPERCSTFTAHVNTCMFMYMYMYYTFVPACLYTQSILDLYSTIIHTSTSRDVSDQAFPVSKCSPPQLPHVNVNCIRGRTGNEAT